MTRFIKKMLASDKMRYLIAGGCTTGVNMVVFFALRFFTQINRNACNAIAIAMAIAFAYFANKFFVFRSRPKGFWKNLLEAFQFVGARLFSMLVEILGLAILCDSFRMRELYAKLLVQFVVLVLNYLFSRLFVFTEKKRTAREWLVDNYCYVIAFAVVAVVQLVVCVMQGIAPFGSHAITLVDSMHQYLPFFSEYRHKLLNEGSLFYSWNVALGSNFMSLSSYYLSSPFNYLFLLFGKDSIVSVVCFLMSFKVCLSAVAMTHFLSWRSGKKERNFTIIALAICYAMSNYVIGYYWNVMWLDCIMIFPLIILGFSRLMERKDPRLYVLSLTYALYCNYYIGYIICVFLVLWFFVYNHKKVKAFFLHGIRFAFYSLVSGGLCAFLLLPAYFGIMSTAAGKMRLPAWEWYGDIFVMFRQQLFLTKPMNMQTFDGGVNLYCGMLAVLAMFLYLFIHGVHPWEKIKHYLLLAFLMVSFNSVTLNYIWHGMHDQYGIPNRFSFLYIFVLLVMTQDVVKNLYRTNWAYVLSGAFLAASFVIACKKRQPASVTTLIFVSSLSLVVAYTVFFLLGSVKKIKKKTLNTVVGAFCAMEMVFSGVYGLMDNGYADYGGKYKNSPATTLAYERVKELAAEEPDPFYRAELMQYAVLDEGSWHNMPSLGTFNSTVLGEVVTTMGRLGFYTGANEFLYKGATPFTNTLFNVRYLLRREGDLNNFMFDYRDTVEGVEIYENPYPGALAYAVSENAKSWDRNAFVPMNGMNILAYDMTGEMGFFTSKYPLMSVDSASGDVSIQGNTIRFSPRASGKAAFMLSFAAEEAGDYYINCRGNYITKIRFYKNGEEYAYDRYQGQVFHLGDLQEGDYISVEYEYSDLSAETTASCYLCAFDEAVFREVYGLLMENHMETTVFEDGYVEGRIYVPEGQTVMTTIPYDKGWKVFVDGEVVEYYAAMDAFIGIDMPCGEHELRFQYIPRGLILGLVISAVSLLLFLLGIYVNNRGKATKRNKNRGENQRSEIDQLENV